MNVDRDFAKRWQNNTVERTELQLEVIRDLPRAKREFKRSGGRVYECPPCEFTKQQSRTLTV